MFKTRLYNAGKWIIDSKIYIDAELPVCFLVSFCCSIFFYSFQDIHWNKIFGMTVLVIRGLVEIPMLRWAVKARRQYEGGFTNNTQNNIDNKITVKHILQVAPNPKKWMFPVSSCSCLCLIHAIQMLSREWRYSWSSATGDAPITSDGSTISLPANVRHILEVWGWLQLWQQSTNLTTVILKHIHWQKYRGYDFQNAIGAMNIPGSNCIHSVGTPLPFAVRPTASTLLQMTWRDKFGYPNFICWVCV